MTHNVYSVVVRRTRSGTYYIYDNRNDSKQLRYKKRCRLFNQCFDWLCIHSDFCMPVNFLPALRDLKPLQATGFCIDLVERTIERTI